MVYMGTYIRMFVEILFVVRERWRVHAGFF